MASVYIPSLHIYLDAYVLDSAPPIISLGKLCKDEGFRYVWDNDFASLNKDDLCVPCHSIDDVPYISTYLAAPAHQSNTQDNDDAELFGWSPPASGNTCDDLEPSAGGNARASQEATASGDARSSQDSNASGNARANTDSLLPSSNEDTSDQDSPSTLKIKRRKRFIPISTSSSPKNTQKLDTFPKRSQF